MNSYLKRQLLLICVSQLRLLRFMFDDDEDFVLDGEGKCVLIGLTFGETIEFESLEIHINQTGPFPLISRDEWLPSEEKRWLELWDKHQAAKVLFLRIRNTQH